jgi:hypothetical protein
MGYGGSPTYNLLPMTYDLSWCELWKLFLLNHGDFVLE